MKVLIVEDSEQRVKWFKEQIGDFDLAQDVATAIEFLKNNLYDYIFLDHDLGATSGPHGLEKPSDLTGYGVAKFIAGTPNENAEIILHSFNPVGVQAMNEVLPKAKPMRFGSFEIKKLAQGKEKLWPCDNCD